MFVDDLVKGFYDVVSKNVSGSIVNRSYDYGLARDHDFRHLNNLIVLTIAQIKTVLPCLLDYIVHFLFLGGGICKTFIRF